MRYARPRRRFHTVIWLFGLAILAWTGRWWPGILILVALSILLEGAMARRRSGEFEDMQPPEAEEKPEAVFTPQSPTETVPAPVERHPAEWLPLSCPQCGAPIRAGEVPWSGGGAFASCPYCGSNLPLKRT